MTMQRHILSALAALFLASGTVAWAQGPPNMAAMQKWREDHKQTFELQNTLTRGLARISESKTTELKPAQAKKLLAVVAGLRKKPKLTQAQAKSSLQAVNKTLDKKQLAAINAAAARVGEIDSRQAAAVDRIQALLAR